jgi:hypothetical protein
MVEDFDDGTILAEECPHDAEYLIHTPQGDISIHCPKQMNASSLEDLQDLVLLVVKQHKRKGKTKNKETI